MENEHTIDLFALTLPYAPEMVELVPPDSVTHGGASIAHANAVDGFSVILFAYVGQTENDLITLYLNDEFADKLTIAKGEEAENTTLTIPSERFQRGHNNIKFGVKRPSQNEEFTKDLILLYRSSPPGDVPPVLVIKVSHESIGADEADDVSVTVTYKNAQWYDRIFVDCNGVVVRYQLVPDVLPPVSAVPQNVIIPIAREVLEQGGDDTDFTFKFRVVDNLTNPSGPPTWSDIVNADVHLNRLTLPAPDVSEDPDDPADDPSTIDLGKVKDFLYVLVHVFSPLWVTNDIVRVNYTCTPPAPATVVTHSAEATVSRLPFTHKLQVPVAKVLVDSKVSVTYEQIRGGKVIGTSKAAEAPVIGEEKLIIEEDFTFIPTKVLAVGQSVDIGSMIITNVRGDRISGDFTGIGLDYIDRQDQCLKVQDIVRISLKGHEATEITYVHRNIQTPNQINFYNSSGQLVHTADMSSVPIKLEANKTFSYFDICTQIVPGSGNHRDYVEIDNIEIR